PRLLFVLDLRNLTALQHEEAPIETLQLDVEIGPAPGKSADRASISQPYVDQLVAGCNARVRFQKRLSQLAPGQLPPHVGEIGTDGRSSSPNHMTGRAFPLAEEELLSGRGRSRRAALGRGRIQRVHECRQRVQFGGGQMKGGHSQRGSALLNQRAQLLRRPAAHAAASCQFGSLIGTLRLRSMTGDTSLGVCRLPLLDRGLLSRRDRRKKQDGDRHVLAEGRWLSGHLCAPCVRQPLRISLVSWAGSIMVWGMSRQSEKVPIDSRWLKDGTNRDEPRGTVLVGVVASNTAKQELSTLLKSGTFYFALTIMVW